MESIPYLRPPLSYGGPCSRWSSEKTLRELVAEVKANEKLFKAKVRTTLRSSYSSY
jgi:hypothetical protein